MKSIKSKHTRKTLMFSITLFIYAIIHLSAYSIVIAQSYSIDGVISTSSRPVSYGDVIFVDNSDTTKKFSTETDVWGSYHINVITSARTDIAEPSSFELAQNYPNPFSSATAIAYQLSLQSAVQLTIYDVLGRTVRTIFPGIQSSGVHELLWDGRNNLGQKVAPGIYFYGLQSCNETQVRKMVLYASAGSIPLSFPHVLPFYGSAKAEVHANTVRAGTYTVRIRGNDTTYPEIYATEFKNIVVYRDTTLNFAVERYFRNEAHIYSDSTKQMIRGFGGMNMPGWIPDMTSAQVNKAFGVNDGQIGMSILRVRVPFDSSKFYLEVPTAKHAASLGATIIASPWSPPAWMKSNNNIVGGILKESAYGAYANHLQSFANYLSGNGVTLQAVSIQNEPDVTVTYESCDWNASQMSKFLKENGQFIGPNIIAPESFHFNSTFADSLLNDPATAANISIIGGHIYGGGLAPYPLAAKKGKELWMTEHLVVNTDWNGALETAKEINDCMLADMNAYIWWYIRRFYGPIDDNSVVTKRGYVISQYARFVRPGYHRIGATPLSQMYVDITAFRNDSTIVIVAVNRATTGLEQAFVIHNGNVNTFMSYSTSSTKNCVKGSDISILNGKFTVTLDASSVTTFVSK